jgi:predicted small lipoprotein YifL
MTRLTAAGPLATILLAAMAASGCGLKGPLILPPKSDEVVIRAPGQAATDQAAPAEGQTTTVPAPAAETEKTKQAPSKLKDERIPPPPLPGGNPGTARGG